MPKSRIGGFWLTQRGGSEAFYVEWYDAEDRRTHRRSLRTRDLQEAELRLAQWVTEHARIRDERPQDVPLATVLERYYREHAVHTRSSEAAKHALRYWLEWFKDVSVSEVTKPRQAAFVRWLEDNGKSRGYVRRIISIGRAAMRYAVDAGYILSSPPVTIPEAEDAEDTAARLPLLTLEQSAALMAVRKPEHVQRYCLIAFCTLARPEAILQLKRFQIDMQNRVLRLNPPGRRQTKKRRAVVPICQTLYDALITWPEDILVSWKGRELRSIRRIFKRSAIAAGVPWATPYTIRRTMATELRARGVPEWEVAGFLGHRIAGTTEIYARYTPDHHSDAVEAIDAYMTEVFARQLRASQKNGRS